MKVDLIDFSNIVYIDPNINDYGILLDGKTPETAYKEVPTLTDNTCYVVRRYDDHAAQFTNSSSAIKNIMLLGMPRPGEKYFEYMSPEIQAAWGNDEGRIGCFKFDKSGTTTPADENWTSTAKHHCIFTALEYMRVENCRFMRTSASKFTSGRGVGFMFVINSSAATIKVNNCEFGYEFTKMKDYFSGHNSLISEEIQKFSHYLNINACSSFSITNSYIDAACVSDYGDGSGNGSTRFLSDFSVRSSLTKFNLQNCEIYTFGRINNTTDHNNQNNGHVFVIPNVKFGYVNNIDFNLLYNKNQIVGCNRGLISFYSNDSGNGVYIHNVTVKQKLFPDYDVQSNAYYTNGVIYLDGYVSNLDIQNINIDLTNEIVKTAYGNGLNCINLPKETPGLCKRLLKDIDIKFYTEDDTISNGDEAYGAIGWSTSFTKNANAYDNRNDDTSDDSINNLIGIAENINIKTNGVALTVDKANVISGVIRGKIIAKAYSYINLTSLTQNCDHYAIQCPLNAANTIKIKNLYLNSNYFIDGKIAISPDNTQTSDDFGNNTIIIENAAYLPFKSSVIANTEVFDRNTIIACYNYENGKFFVKNRRSYAISSAITRNNAQSNSILQVVSNKSATPSNTYLRFGNNSLMPGFKQTLTSGIYDITFYFSCYNFVPNVNSVNIFINSFDNSGNNFVSYSGELEEDTSVWSDENVTAYKLTIKDVVIPKDIRGNIIEQDLFTDFVFNFYANNGYIYLDTIPTTVKTGEYNGLVIKPELM